VLKPVRLDEAVAWALANSRNVLQPAALSLWLMIFLWCLVTRCS